MALVNLNFESQYLNGNTEVSIILPDKPRDQGPTQFYGNGHKYKVLWLLHGTFGDHTDWLRKSSIELYACEKDLIVVMPSALNSDYTNWDHCMMGYAMYDFLTEELMPLVYNWFPASDKREDNYISGLSMGGEGALIYALGHSQRFAAAAVLSWAPRNYVRLLAAPGGIQEQRLLDSIANAGGVDKFLASGENCWQVVADKVKAGADLPRLYFTCGTNDFLYDWFTEFRAYAGEIGLEAKFEEIEGYTHEWRFWDLTIQRAFEFFGLGADVAGNPF